jgi:hypothetical protein
MSDEDKKPDRDAPTPEKPAQVYRRGLRQAAAVVVAVYRHHQDRAADARAGAREDI